MTGRRRDDGRVWEFAPGEYGKSEQGDWYAMTPAGLLAGLRNHEVVEHHDGTITVSPSILVTGGQDEAVSWHGYLELGSWREV